ncbi:MAG: endolytic transglycosylase MltG [Thermoleophilia bacterium]|nr:endolytic transglycosylase MltG [Thermoleophilia bacterium]
MSTSRRPRGPARATPVGRTVIKMLVPIIGLFVVIVVVLVLVGGRVSGGGGVVSSPQLVDVLFPEGLRRSEMAATLENNTGVSAATYLAATDPSKTGQALAGATTPTSLEGFLFPATYPVDPARSVAELVDYQVRTYVSRTADVDYSYANKRNLTKYDVLILASIVEREALRKKDRGLIAGVFYNRLRLGMRIDSDVTVNYVIGSWSKALTAADLRIDSPYNTRRYLGLPPGPICNPGLESIEAAANPTPTPYLFFVASPSGTVYYATDEADFAQVVARAGQEGG